ncbi:MAG: hypothetical protein IJK97_11235, partial [Thermoguttaceae bacterium]|nr:hypothetical protein [Thermoguttaceae bacterium]
MRDCVCEITPHNELFENFIQEESLFRFRISGGQYFLTCNFTGDSGTEIRRRKWAGFGQNLFLNIQWRKLGHISVSANESELDPLLRRDFNRLMVPTHRVHRILVLNGVSIFVHIDW